MRRSVRLHVISGSIAAILACAAVSASEPVVPDCCAVHAPSAASAAPGAASLWMLDTSPFPARWNCGTWSAGLGWTHIVSDLLTWAAYLAIPISLLIILLRRRQDLPFKGILALFSAFIVLCGTVHLVEAVIFWWPIYRIQAVIKAATAIVSVVTVIALVRMIPRVLTLRTPESLEREVKTRTADLAESRNQLDRALRAAEAATRSKSQFLANMSHEIRTPLTAILGYAELLQEQSRDKEARQHLYVIRRNGEHLLSIINDILDLSKIEAGRLDLSTDSVDLLELVRDVKRMLEVRLRNTELQLHVDYAWPLPRRIETDATRLRQILLNLLGNSLKFTEKGEVRLSVSMSGASDSPHIQFLVSDTGIGIASGDQQRLFRPFTQVDTSNTRRFGGTGLGLNISRRLARMLGGDLTLVRSVPGGGSTFLLSIAAGELADGLLESHPDDPARLHFSQPESGRLPFRILVAEDGPDNQRMLQLILKRAGADVRIVENGREAVEAALEAEADGRPFDVVLMDMQMPVLDGLNATRRLREAGYLRPIIALTAHAMAESRAECLAAGCSDFASKPIRKTGLFEQIRRQAGRLHSPDESPAY